MLSGETTRVYKDMTEKPQIGPETKIGIVANKSYAAQDAYETLLKQYDLIPLADTPDAAVDLIVVLGGDGFMLHTLHRHIEDGIPIYGMNCGTVGFLMNTYQEEHLLDRLEDAQITTIHPLQMVATTEDGKEHRLLAINEVSLLRNTAQAARIKVIIDGDTRLEQTVCDGVLVATPAGSSAYNASLGGPIIPLKAEALALTPISPFRPRRWRGALLPSKAETRFEIINAQKRPVNAVADFTEVEHITAVTIALARDIPLHLLFDPGHSLEERILKEQFTT